jgi:ubiquinone biosynthesis protein COQ4
MVTLSQEPPLIQAYTRPAPLYEGHVPLSTPERMLLAVGSAFMSLYNPWRGGNSFSSAN